MYKKVVRVPMHHALLICTLRVQAKAQAFLTCSF